MPRDKMRITNKEQGMLIYEVDVLLSTLLQKSKFLVQYSLFVFEGLIIQFAPRPPSP